MMMQLANEKLFAMDVMSLILEQRSTKLILHPCYLEVKLGKSYIRKTQTSKLFARFLYKPHVHCFRI